MQTHEFSTDTFSMCDTHHLLLFLTTLQALPALLPLQCHRSLRSSDKLTLKYIANKCTLSTKFLCRFRKENIFFQPLPTNMYIWEEKICFLKEKKKRFSRGMSLYLWANYVANQSPNSSANSLVIDFFSKVIFSMYYQ